MPNTEDRKPESQLLRVRREVHRKAKAAAGALGITLEQFASDTLDAAADKALSRKGAK